MLKLIAASTLITGSVLLAAGTQSDPPANPPTPDKLNIVAIDAASTVSVDFKGGTLNEYITAIRTAQPNANIVVTPEAGAFSIPAINLKNAELWEAMKLLSSMSDGPFARLIVEPVGRAFSIRSSVVEQHDPVTDTRVWSIKSLLATGLSLDDIVAAIDTVSDTAPDKRYVKFHEQTSLLVVGTKIRDLDAIGRVLQTLQDAAAIERSAAPADVFANELATLKARVDVLEKALKSAGN